MNKYLYAFVCVCFSILVSGNAYAQAPVANFSASTTSGCSPIVANFTDLSTNTPTSWYWDLGNGSTSTLQNPSTTYITAGTYTVTLTATNSSGSNTKTVTNYITVAPSPVVAFTADTTPVCSVPRTITFTNNSVPGGTGTTTYLWDFGDGTTSTAANPTKTYTAYGNYTVTLLVTNGNGCSKSLIKPSYIKIATKPTAAFTVTNNNACTAPATVSFTNTSTGAVSYNWDFGDGNTSTSTSPSHTYTANGNYNVRLIATNATGCKDTITSNSIVTIGAPSASFNMSTNSTCTGKIVNFTNTSSPAGYTSYWTFGTGAASTSTNEVYIYNTPGTYTVTLVVTRLGCSDTDSKTITVNANPTINFTASPTEGCLVPFATNFTNTSTSASSYTWHFGDGSTSTATNPSKTYTALGNYSVKLIATNSSGCTDSLTRTNYIKIQQPTATISIGAFSGCAPITVNFTANVTTLLPVSNYTWNFGDGSSTVSCSSCPTVGHTYTSSGVYTVTLTYTTGTGCTYSATTSVNINTKPTASFTASPTTICPGTAVTFSNSSTGASSYDWNFGNGASSTLANPVYSGYTMGTYTVTLIANNNGCRDTLVRSGYITVNPPEAKFGITTSCSNRYAITLSDSSVGANTYLWDFGDTTTSTQAGGTLTHTYTYPGTKVITLTVVNTTYSCSSSFTRNINIQPITADFTISDTTLCKGQNTEFNCSANSIITNKKWDFGNGVIFNTGAATVYYNYSTSGIFSPKLVITDVNGCKDSVTKTNYIKVGGATVDFTGSPLIGCTPFTASFTDNSTPNGGFAITNRTWDFVYGGLQSTSGSTISYTYIYSGTWPVKLIVTDANGCKDSLTKNNYVLATRPIAQFHTSDTIICVGQSALMVNNSGGASFTSIWYWGDGTSSTGTTQSHVYSAAGNYTVRLVITDMYGCSDSMTKTAYIHVTSPAVNFTMSDTVANCPPLLVNFTNTSSNVTSYTWVFGNGSQSTVTNPTTLYTYPGVYGVKLIGTTVSGCKDSVTKNITIYGPTGSFSYSPLAGCNPVTVNFTSSTTNATSLIWDMSNGYTQTTTGSTFTYTYTSTGKYQPKLILSDGSSCLVPLFGTDTIKVDNINADFSFTPNNICSTGTVQFTDTVSSAISTVTTRSWTFGDGGTSTAHNPSHLYAAPGTYTVRLIAGNAQGCLDTVIKLVTILAPPNVVASSNQSICPGTSTPVTISASGALSYVWSPSTGLSCTNCASPTALPTVTTTYIVTGTDANGCTDTASVIVSLNNRPTVTASANSNAICIGNNTTLTATGATSYVWTPATGLSCTSCAAPTATPTTTTTYTVTGTDANGCTDTGVVTVTVNTLPTVSAGSNVAICTGSSTSLTATGANSYVWTPATGLSCTSCANPTANPTTTTTYIVTGTNANGCIDTGVVTVTVNPLPTVSAGNNTSVCDGFPATLTASGASTYVWSPSGSLSCNTCVNPTANPTTTTTYTLTGTDANGCINTATITVAINTKPTVTASANSNAICIGNNTTLTATGATSYVWTPATGLSCTSCAAPTATPTTTTTYTVTGTDANGCTDTGVVTVTVNTLPTVSAGSNVAICTGSSTSLAATGANSYVWTPATGLSCTSCANPTANPTSTTTYIVTGTNANGCIDTGVVTVTVNPLPTVSAGNNTSVCDGFPATLTASGASTYVWSPSGSLSCNTCVNPTANPTTTTTYTLTGTDANGCINTATVTVAINTKPTVTASVNSSAICIGNNTTLTATGATSYVWTPATGLSCTSCAAPTATPTTTTTYTVTGTDANGCTDTGVVTVTVNTLPTVSAGSNVAICTGSSTSLTATGATSYVWTPGTGLSCTSCPNPTANPPVLTIYTVTGTDVNGCQNTSTVRVNVNPLPTVSAGNNTSVCSGFPATLTASGASTYVWSPSGSLSCNTCINPTANPTTTTTYTLTGTDTNGCINTATVTVAINTKPTVTASANSNAICIGNNTTLTATGATSYVWTPSTGLSCTSCATATANPTTTTTYTVTGTDANGCTDTGVVTVTVNTLPTVSAGSNVAICTGSSTSLAATGANSYVWTPTTGLSCTSCANPTANPTTTTTYIVTGTNANGCTDTGVVTVTVNPLPTVSAGNNTSVCSGFPATLTASGASTYVWSPSGSLSCNTCVNPTANPTTTTTYTLTGTDANGCINSATVTVAVNAKPNVGVTGTNIICNGSSTTLTATGATSYVWTPATGLSCTACTAPVSTPSATTSYIVTGTDGNGCTDTGMITVTVNTKPVVNAGTDRVICAGASTGLTATGATSYVWSPATGLSCVACASPTASPSVTLTYSVIGTDGNSCTDTDEVMVTVNPLPLVSAGPPQSICDGASATLTASGAVSYVWTPGASLSCTACVTPTASPTTTTTYTVTGTDANGCIASNTTTITVDPIPVVTVTGAKTICEGQSTTLTASGATSYTWSPATALSCTICNNPTANPATTTTYTVTGNNNGCTSSTTVIITVLPKPIITVSADTEICAGGSVPLVASGAATYSWAPASGLSCTACPNPIATPTSTTTYIVTGTGADGCSGINQVKITVNPGPDVNAGEDKTICNGASVQLNATGAGSYVWKPGNTLSCTNCASPVSKPSVNTTYTVVGVDNIGCSDSDQVTISVIEKGPVKFGPDAAFCKGESAELYATGGTSYLWIPADGLSNHQADRTKASPETTTKYAVIVKQGDCFADTGYITVVVHDLPIVELGPDVTIGGGSSVQLNAAGDGIVKYEWTPAQDLSCYDCQKPKASPLVTTKYTVLVTNQYGCKAADNITVKVTCDNGQIFIPNTFTPNNDGVNDRFYPQGKGIKSVKSFKVYNRWGELLFAREDMKMNDPSIGWDGTYKNTPLKPDVFVYIINAYCESGEPINLKGDISLIR